MNKVFLSGRLTSDIELRFSKNENQTAFTSFSLAVDHWNGKENEAYFIRCKAFGKTAELLESYCKKGSKILLEGEWTTGSYKDKDGFTVYTNDCLIQKVEFCAPAKDKEEPKQDTRRRR